MFEVEDDESLPDVSPLLKMNKSIWAEMGDAGRMGKRRVEGNCPTQITLWCEPEYISHFNGWGGGGGCFCFFNHEDKLQEIRAVKGDCKLVSRKTESQAIKAFV